MRPRSLTQTEEKTHMPQKTQRMVNLPPNIISIQAFPLYFKCWTYVPLLFDIKKAKQATRQIIPSLSEGFLHELEGEGGEVSYILMFFLKLFCCFFSGLKPFDTHREFSNTLYDGCKLSYRML